MTPGRNRRKHEQQLPEEADVMTTGHTVGPVGNDSTSVTVVGVDFGTLSARAVVVRADDGAELGTGVAEYASGAIERSLPTAGAGVLPPDWALQDPYDWRSALGSAVRAALADAGVAPESVVGIGTDFTACTFLPTLADGTPLCEVPELRERPHAWPKLWKHHAAQDQADRITDLAHARGEAWIARYGGRISSEWQFAKALQALEEDPAVYRRAARRGEGAPPGLLERDRAPTRHTLPARPQGGY